jgi:hypothetical protein
MFLFSVMHVAEMRGWGEKHTQGVPERTAAATSSHAMEWRDALNSAIGSPLALHSPTFHCCYGCAISRYQSLRHPITVLPVREHSSKHHPSRTYIHIYICSWFVSLERTMLLEEREKVNSMDTCP